MGARAYVLGAGVDRLTLQQTIDEIERWIAERDSHKGARYVVATGFHGIWEGHRDASFRRVINSADISCADGIAPVIASRLRGEPIPERVPGPDVLRAFLARADERGYRSYFFGDTQETLDALEDNLQRLYPGHVIAGTCSPPFRPLAPEETQAMIDAINASGADVLWVGLGCPKQERWIAEHRHRLQVPVAMGVGAAFGFASGRVSRAPAWVGRFGLEWAWRLAAEPRKLWRRTLVQGPQFVFHLALELMGLRRYPRGDDDQTKGASH
ncbi:MAG: WecB/TagA/CpsF family glycosyltransferase [Pseudomonadota bacterium]